MIHRVPSLHAYTIELFGMPSRSWMLLKSAPEFKRWVAKECRSVWGNASGDI